MTYLDHPRTGDTFRSFGETLEEGGPLGRLILLGAVRR
jgi:hypothetical protein